MGRIWNDVLCYIERLGAQEWTLILAAVVVLGFFCMRGFGSRSEY